MRSSAMLSALTMMAGAAALPQLRDEAHAPFNKAKAAPKKTGSHLCACGKTISANKEQCFACKDAA